MGAMKNGKASVGDLVIITEVPSYYPRSGRDFDKLISVISSRSVVKVTDTDGSGWVYVDEAVIWLEDNEYELVFTV